MTNYIVAFMVAFLGLNQKPEQKYENPVNYKTQQQTYVKPIDTEITDQIYVEVQAGESRFVAADFQDSYPTYDEIRYEAMYSCKNNKSPSESDVKLIDDLIKIEKKYKVPRSLRGMLLAAACVESGFNPFAKGDYRTSKRTNKRRAMAIGLLQQWPWVVKFYKIDRKNPLQAADVWMQHVIRQMKSVKKECKPRSEKKQWIAAWVKSIRAPKKHGNRCAERPTHYRVLRKWQRGIMKDREVRESDGC